jgi:hypothetical protein
MNYFVQLHHLRKSRWTIINEGVAKDANLSMISPGCRLHTGGYAGLYTYDIDHWAVIHTATDVDSHQLSARTGTGADLKRMFKDALCPGGFVPLDVCK